MRETNPWQPRARHATIYGLVVAGVAMTVMLVTLVMGYDSVGCADALVQVCGTPERYVLAFAPTGILMAGGLGAFARTYQLWRRGEYARAWHGAGWALFLLMTVFVVMSSPVLLNY